MFYDNNNAEDLSSIAPSVSAPLTSAPTQHHQQKSSTATTTTKTLTRHQQYENQQPAALLMDDNDDDANTNNDDGEQYQDTMSYTNDNNRNNNTNNSRSENIRLVRQLPDDLMYLAAGHHKQQQQQRTSSSSGNRKQTQNHTENIRRLRHNHVGVSFGTTVPQTHHANCPIMNEELDDIMSSAEKIRKCTCTRKAPMLNLRREIATIRSNENRYQKTQSEQLRQYKDEAKHLAKVSRAFREENSRLQRVLEEKSKQVADAEERRTKEHLRVADIDEKCQNWFVKLDDLRDENDLLAEMSSKSRSEADHLRAALDQAMSENLKLKTAMARQKEKFISFGGNNNNNNNNTNQNHQIENNQHERRASPSPSMPPSLFVNNNNNNVGATAVGGLPPSSTSTNRTSNNKNVQLPPHPSRQQNNNNVNHGVGLVEDFNFLRQAVNEVKAKCKCSTGSSVGNQNQHQQQQQDQVSNSTNSPSPVKCSGTISVHPTTATTNRDCSVPLGAHKYSSATPFGGAVYTPTEKLEKAMDQIRQRVHSIDQELQICRQEEQRWRTSAQEMKTILDSQSSSDKERGEIFQQQQQRIRQLEQKLQQHQNQNINHDYFTSSSPSPNTIVAVGNLHKIKTAPSNSHSATADVTNLESQLQYAKGQIATLDFQLQTLQKHMNAEMDKVKAQKDEAIAAARANAVQETENRLRDEIRQTTSGSFLEEMSTKLQETQKRLQTLEMSHTTSEATKRQQQTEIENLRARLEKETSIAVQLEPTQRALAQMQKERDAMRVKLNHVEHSLDVLRQSETQCAEEIAHLRERSMKAEAEVEELHSNLSTTTLKLHQEVEANKNLRQRLEDTVDRSNSIVRQSKKVFDEQMNETRERLNQETNQRVNVEARASALECNLRSVREEVERIRRVQLHWS